MQIKYRITLVFTLIVTVILLLLCGSVYFFSYKDRVQHFKSRLLNKALSTVELLQTREFSPDLIATVNRTSPSSLVKKSITLYDYRYDGTFFFSDSNVSTLVINSDIINKAKAQKTYYFQVDDRDAVAIHYEDGMYNYIVAVAAYDEYKEEWMGELRLILFISFFCSICIVVGTGYFFSLTLVSSIRNLTQKINHISFKDISQRLDTGKEKDELQQLAATINGLLSRLQQSFDTQRRFISNASHELATPLAAIISQLDVALQNERSNAEYQKVIRSVKDDMKRLGLLVKSLLEIAKASGSSGGIELAAVRIDEILMAIPSEIKKISPLYDVKLTFEDFPDSESAFTVYGNDALLYSALKNIIHNACKFSSDNTAYVQLGFTYNNIIITIGDKGPGISAQELEHIFQPFFRGSKQSNRIHGTGLGLALANTIVGLHKGSIEVESKLGIGSTFRIILPVDK